MMQYYVASPELRSLMSKAGHTPISGTGWRGSENGLKVVVSEVIRGHTVELTGLMVERNTLDGPADVLQITSKVDGVWVNRARLFQLCGDLLRTT